MQSTLNNIRKIADNRERENATIELFNQALDEQNTELLREIAEFVISQNDMRNTQFSHGWQLHCLNWLTGYYGDLWRNSKEGSAEDRKYLHELLSCLWEYKWLVGILPCDLTPSKQHIEESLGYMGQLYADFEFSPAMVHKAAMEQAMFMGNVDAAKAAFAQWQAAEKDGMNDCDACEQSSLVKYYYFIGDYARAIELAQPIVDGDLVCGEVPHVTYYAIISSLIQMNQISEAKSMLSDAIDLVMRDDDEFLYLMPQLLQLCIHLGNKEQAEHLLAQSSAQIENAVRNHHYDFLQYLIAVAPLNADALPVAQNLAKAFDERNGNRYYQNQLDLMFVEPVMH